MKLVTIVCILAGGLLMVPTSAQYNPADLANGWYNLPPVTVEQVSEKINCLVAAGAPAAPRLVAHGLFRKSNSDLAFGPTQIRWEGRNPRTGEFRTLETDAVLTRYGPRIAYVEIAHAFGLDVEAQVFCPDKAATVQIRNPIGKHRPDWCEACYESIGAAEDKFAIGALIESPDGTYVKKVRWFGFVSAGYWERQ